MALVDVKHRLIWSCLEDKGVLKNAAKNDVDKEATVVNMCFAALDRLLIQNEEKCTFVIDKVVINELFRVCQKHADASVVMIAARIFAVFCKSIEPSYLDPYRHYDLDRVSDAVAIKIVRTGWNLISPAFRPFVTNKVWVIMMIISALNHGHHETALDMFTEKLKEAKFEHHAPAAPDEEEEEDQQDLTPASNRQKRLKKNDEEEEAQQDRTPSFSVRRRKAVQKDDRFAIGYLTDTGLSIFKSIKQLCVPSIQVFSIICKKIEENWKKLHEKCMVAHLDSNAQIKKYGRENVMSLANACLRNGMLLEFSIFTSKLGRSTATDHKQEASLWAGSPTHASSTMWLPEYRTLSNRDNVIKNSKASEEQYNMYVSLYTSCWYLIVLWFEAKLKVRISGAFSVVQETLQPHLMSRLTTAIEACAIIVESTQKLIITLKNHDHKEGVNVVLYLAFVDACFLIQSVLMQSEIHKDKLEFYIAKDTINDTLKSQLIVCHTVAHGKIKQYMVNAIQRTLNVTPNVKECTLEVRKLHYMPMFALMQKHGDVYTTRYMLPSTIYSKLDDVEQALSCLYDASWGELAVYVRSGQLAVISALREVSKIIMDKCVSADDLASFLSSRYDAVKADFHQRGNRCLAHVDLQCLAAAKNFCAKQDASFPHIDIVKIIQSASLFENKDPFDPMKYANILTSIVQTAIDGGYNVHQLVDSLDQHPDVCWFFLKHSQVGCDIMDKFIGKNVQSLPIKKNAVIHIIKGAFSRVNGNEYILVKAILDMDTSHWMRKTCIDVLSDGETHKWKNKDKLTEGWLLLRTENVDAYNSLFLKDPAECLKKSLFRLWVFKYKTILSVENALTLKEIQFSLQIVSPRQLGLSCTAIAIEYARLLRCVVSHDRQQALSLVTGALEKMQQVMSTELTKKNKGEWENFIRKEMDKIIF